MIAKEFNAALSDEKVREQWLKRILPALAITVIYFVFISDTLVTKGNKAEDAFKVMLTKGLSEDAMPSMRMQVNRLKEELEVLKKRDEEVKADLSAKAAFLYGETEPNAIIDQISQLMLAHHLRVIEEIDLGNKKLDELPRSFMQLKTWLGDVLQTEETIHVHRLKFAGHYADVYQALREMALSENNVMPLFLSMQDPNADDGRYFGMKIWILDLWI